MAFSWRQASFFIFMTSEFKPKISVFHCINSFDDAVPIKAFDSESADLTFVHMACSSMVKDVFLLRAFESGADAVIVLVCPDGQCRYVQGNLRAEKRVTYVRKILDNIGLDGRRLALHHSALGNTGIAGDAIGQMCGVLRELGPNPAV